MEETTRRNVVEGLVIGLIAGVIMAAAELGAAALMGGDPVMPFRMFASVLFGDVALSTMGPTTAYISGLVIHLALSAVFGLIYGFISAALDVNTRTSLGTQAAFGVAFGLALWLVNFHVIARAFFPWFLEAGQAIQAVIHAVFFGLPLGLLMGARERRVHRVRSEPTPA